MSDTTSGGDFLTRAEVAAWLRCTPDHLARLAVTGQGPKFINLSLAKQGQCHYRRCDVEAWLAARAVGGEQHDAGDRVTWTCPDCGKINTY